jgi:hypothetical protein
MGRPNQTHERLDALLDGQTGEVTDDLAPLLEAAEALRAELAEFQLDPEVADRHLEQVLNSDAPVVSLPVRQRGRWGLRRRVAAVALAAALVLVPATMASASALPGQALYPVKLAVEQVRLASVQWSATREAAVRTGLASKRLQELDRLVQLQIFSQVPPAIRRLDKAVVAAKVAFEEAAAEEGADDSELAAMASKFREVAVAQHAKLVQLSAMVSALPPDNRREIEVALATSPATPRPVTVPPVPPEPGPQPEPSPPPNPPDPTLPPPGPDPTQPQPSTPPAPDPTQPEPSTPPGPDPTQPPPPPTPTSAPTTTVAPEGNPGGAGSGRSDGTGKSEVGPTESTGPSS